MTAINSILAKNIKKVLRKSLGKSFPSIQLIWFVMSIQMLLSLVLTADDRLPATQ